jgi:hypothetical protein
MTQHGASRDEDLARATYLAIRQPAVVRLLETSLNGGDGDAFAAGLELACRILEQAELADGAAPPRIDHGTLGHAVRAVADDDELTAWVGRQLEALPVVLTATEHARVAAVVAAVLWSLAAQRGGAGHDVLA